MAEPIAEGDEDGRLQSLSENDVSVPRKVIRQPNRRHHERELQALTEQISAKEEERKSLGRPNIEATPAETTEKENLLKELKRLREEKETTIAKRKEYDDDIHKLSDSISKKSDALSRIKANLPHKTEKAVDDAIRKLEYQLQTQHFKLRDEKRILNEITNLKRSKKQLHEYLAKRTELETDIRRKEVMKKQKNIYFKRVSELRSKEDEKKQMLMRLKSKADEAWTRYREAGPERDRLKKEIDSLYETRRQLSGEYQSQMRDFKEFAELQRIENERRKEDEKKEKEANHRREWFEYESSREPFEDERMQIECLMTYLTRLLPKGEGLSRGGSPLSGASPSASVSSGSSLGRSSSFKDEEGTFTILRKKADEEDEVFLQAAVKKKKGKRKSWMNKPLRHSREMFNQFANVDLSAPSTAMEIQDVMEKLQAKLQYYEDAAASVKMAHSAIPEDLSASSSLSSGIVTATDFEDFYDFPEEQQINIAEGGVNLGLDVAADVKENVGNIDDTAANDGLVGEGQKVKDNFARDGGIRESAIVEGDGLLVHNGSSVSQIAAHSNEMDAPQVSPEGAVRSDSATDECGSSGSDDGKEAGNVTDDSESTVVANEGESGQCSPSDVSVTNKDAHDASFRVNVDASGLQPQSDVKSVSESLQGQPKSWGEVVSQEIVGDDDNDDDDGVDKDREDSGMVDIQEDPFSKGGIVERKNESLKLIMSRKSEKDLDGKSDLLVTSSQTEYSSDYASNSTGSAVSTPTDVLPIQKRELVLDVNPLSTKDLMDHEMPMYVLRGDNDGDDVSSMNSNNNSSTAQSQQPLQLSHDALHVRSVCDDASGREQRVFQSGDIPEYLIPQTKL